MEIPVAVLGIMKAGAAYVPLDPEFPADRVAFRARRLPGAGRGDNQRLRRPRWPAEERRPRGRRGPTRRGVGGATGFAFALIGCRVDALGPLLRDLHVWNHRQAQGRGNRASQRLPSGPRRRAAFPSAARGPGIIRGFPSPLTHRWRKCGWRFSRERRWSSARRKWSAPGRDWRRCSPTRGVTVLSCVPTLLAMMEEDVPTVRLLILGGEACPPDLVKRWWKPGRRVVNTYGPTEATVIATFADCHPGQTRHHWPPAAELFCVHSRRTASARRGGRGGRIVPGRHRTGARLSGTAGIDARKNLLTGRKTARRPGGFTAPATWRAGRGGRNRIPRPDGRSGENSRLPR